MNIDKELLDDRQVKLVVSVDDEQVQKALRDAARRIAKKVNIPGFRRGKAPFHIIKQYLGDGALYDEALDPLGQTIYAAALDEAEVEPYAPGSLDDVSFDPMILTFTIPLHPEVALGSYRDLRVEFQAPVIDSKDVDDALKQMQHEQATLETADRDLSMGDAGQFAVEGVYEVAHEDHTHDHKLIDSEDVKILASEDATYPLPGFPEKVLGMKVNETREFEIDVEDSEDYDEEMRGKTVRFKATLKEVFSYELPVLDDEFAKSFSDFDTLDELRQDLSRKLFDAVKQQKRDEHIDELFEKLQGIVKVNYPPIMLEDEIDSSVERFKQQVAQAFQGLQFEDYLRIANKTESDLREEFEESAKKNLFRGLVLSQLVEEEALEVSDEEIDDELQTALLSFGGNAAIARQFLNSPENRRNIKNQLLTEKALDRLSEIAQGQAPALDEIQALKEQARAESEEEAKPGKKRSPKKKASVSDSKQRAEKFKDESVLTLEPTAETTSEESDE